MRKKEQIIKGKILLKVMLDRVIESQSKSKSIKTIETIMLEVLSSYYCLENRDPLASSLEHIEILTGGTVELTKGGRIIASGDNGIEDITDLILQA